MFFSLLIVGCRAATSDDYAAREGELDALYSQLSDEDKRKPEWAVAGLTVAPGLEATLFAAEPMLMSPSNMDIDHRGRIWTIEVVNYRPTLNPSNPQREEGDRILILEDTTGDGVADTQKVFYQGPDVNSALGIAVLGNQVIVSAGPNVMVLTDTNGDDTPDTKELLFTGISGDQHDHGVHAFVFGPDGKLYFNFGDQGKQIRDRHGNLIVDMAGNEVTDEGNPYRKGMIFRCNPDGSEFEVLAHNFRNNYEVAVDSYGTLWQSDNDDDGNRAVRINYVMPFGNYGYTDEMTGAGWRTRRTNMEAEIPIQHWHQNDPGVVPNLLVTGAGSPTGILVYEGRLLPEVYWDQMIHADAGPNVVRAYPVANDGAGYTAEIADLVHGTRDQWFRPSDLTVAPDGSLFIADWYDPGVGGHQKGDLERGRVFRIAPPNTPYRIPEFDLSTAAGAIEALKNPNLSVRYLAWNRLHEMQQGAEPELLTLWQDRNPRFRARALWLLAKMEGQGPRFVDEALRDADANIRMTGLRIAQHLKLDVIPYVERMVRDASPQVRREAILALRHHSSPDAARLWTELALQHDGRDRWYLEALGIAADRQWDRFFDTWKARVGDEWNSPAGRDIVWRARSGAAMPLMAEVITDPGIGASDQLRYFRAFDFHQDPSKNQVLLTMLDGQHPHQAQVTALALQHVSLEHLTMTPNVQAALARTLTAVRGTEQFVDLVGRYELRDQNEELLRMALAQPDSSAGINASRLLLRLEGQDLMRRALQSDNRETALAAVTVLGRSGNQPAQELIEAVITNRQYDLDVRNAAVQSLRGWGGEDRLLGIVRRGALAEELEPAAAGVLFSASRSSVRDEASQYIRQPEAGGADALPPVTQLVAQIGDAHRGQPVFARACQMCHVVNGEGINFGPELSEIGNKLSKEAMYAAILDPDAGINFGYEGYAVRMKDGSQVVGMIISETSDALELRLPGGVTSRYSKSDIESRQQLENSLMPANLHHAMTQQELVDLVEYLSTLRQASLF